MTLTHARNAIFAGVLAAVSGTASAAVVSGGINANGTPQVSSTKYTVTHTGTGTYTLKFTGNFGPAPICLYTPVGDVVVSDLGEGTGECVVQFYNPNTSQPTDVIFNFIAVPISH